MPLDVHNAICKIQAVQRGRIGRRKAIKKRSERGRSKAHSYHKEFMEKKQRQKERQKENALLRRTIYLLDILRKPKNKRSPQQCRKLLHWLRTTDLLPLDSTRQTGLDVCQMLTHQKILKGKTLFKQYTTAWSCYAIISGEMEVFANDQKVAEMGPNQFFGATSMKRVNGVRAATVVAKTNVHLAVLSRECYITLISLQENSAIVSHAKGLLLQCPILNHNAIYDLKTRERIDKWNLPRAKDLVQRLIFRELKKKDFIFKEGEKRSNSLFFLLKGRALALKWKKNETQIKLPTGYTPIVQSISKQIRLRSFKTGDYFGEDAVLIDIPRYTHYRDYSVQCTERSLIGEIYKVEFDNVFDDDDIAFIISQCDYQKMDYFNELCRKDDQVMLYKQHVQNYAGKKYLRRIKNSQDKQNLKKYEYDRMTSLQQRLEEVSPLLQQLLKDPIRNSLLDHFRKQNGCPASSFIRKIKQKRIAKQVAARKIQHDKLREKITKRRQNFSRKKWKQTQLKAKFDNLQSSDFCRKSNSSKCHKKTICEILGRNNSLQKNRLKGISQSKLKQFLPSVDSKRHPRFVLPAFQFPNRVNLTSEKIANEGHKEYL